MKIERFEDIEGWQLARELTRKVYALTKKEKFARDFGLNVQIQDVYDHAGHTRATIRGFINHRKLGLLGQVADFVPFEAGLRRLKEIDGSALDFCV
jgi:hypothetical protein